MSKQPPPAPTASAIGPCPTIIKISRTPWHWKFTQHHRTTRPPHASHVEIVSKIKEIIEGDARFTIRDIAWKVGIVLSLVHFILKKHLKIRRISSRWMPHLLTDEQKRQRVKVAKKLLQMFQKYNKKQFANLVKGDKSGSIILSPSESLIRSGPRNTADAQ